MPYLNDLTDKDKEDQQQSGGPQISAGSQVFGAGGNFPSPQSAQANAQKGSGQFADLSEYLRVNQPQGFGTELAGKVGQDVQQAGDTVQNTGQEFKNRVNASTVQQDKDLVDQATGEKAADFASSEDNVKAFQKQSNAEYMGPDSFADSNDLFAKASGAAETAAGKARAASTEGGRFALLDNYFGRENYTPGQKALDNLIAQNDPNAQQAFSQMQKNADQVATNEQQQEKDLSSYAAQGKSTTEATRAAARNALGIDESGNVISDESGSPKAGAIGNLYGSLKSKADTTRAGYEKATKDIGDALASHDLTTLTPEELSMLGLDYRGGLFGVDPTKYLSAVPESDVNINTTTSKDEAARMKALLKLGGLDDTYLDESQAGTAPTDYTNFDTGRFNSDLAAARSQNLKTLGATEPADQSAFDTVARIAQANKVGDSQFNYMPQTFDQQYDQVNFALQYLNDPNSPMPAPQKAGLLPQVQHAKELLDAYAQRRAAKDLLK
jgi:hypothetical protein